MIFVIPAASILNSLGVYLAASSKKSQVHGGFMTGSTADNFFTAKHARLTRIASIANLFAWIVFIIHILWVGGSFIQTQNTYTIQNMNLNLGQNPDFMEMLRQNPLYTASLIVNLTGIFLRGVVYGLTLKGISLGLNMIVETDLNYKENFQGGSNE
jgi:hypothetical protein